jgi:hypothetical protein
MDNTNSIIIEEMLSVFDCIIHENEATYISIPITTGLRFLDWYKREGKNVTSNEEYNDLHYKYVMLENINASAYFVEQVRKVKSNVVIEPTKLVVKDWVQIDYHNFWVGVINRFIKEAYFTSGWYLSKGCVLEYLTAKRKGIPAYDMNNHEISIDEGCLLIESTISEYSKLGLETSFFADILSKLKNGVFVK